MYRRGWCGINIDAAPGSMKSFNEIRKRDINLEIAVGNSQEEMNYYYLGENNSMNTFLIENLKMLGMDKHIKEVIKIKSQSLEAILDQHLPPGKEIDFFTIDVEGLEIEVLRSNNWDKYKPYMILLESFEQMNQQHEYDLEFTSFLMKLGYKVFSKTPNGIFFIREGLKFTPTNRILFPKE